MRKKIKKTLALNKVTICKLDNFEMGFLYGGTCPPPSVTGEATCPKLGCHKTITDPTKDDSTAGC